MVTFESVPPTSTTTLNTTLSGSFEIAGLIQACKTGTVGMYESPLIDQKWQIQLSFNDPSYVRLSFLAKHCPTEALDRTGDRKGIYEVSVSMRLGLMNQNHTEPFRRYQPTQYTFPASGWSHDYWISKSGILDYKHSEDIASLVYNITERSEEVPQVRPPISLPDVSASLFDDEETSNVVFAISDPRRSTRHDDFIYAHTKILSIRSEYFKSIFASKVKDILGSSIHESDLGVKEFSDISESELEEEDMTDGTLTPEDSLKDFTSTLKRRVVRVNDASYATYRAMLYFLYTGLYNFAPLTSASQPNRTSGDSVNDFSDPLADCNAFDMDIPFTLPCSNEVPRSSAKSIYKLCERLDIPELKAAALEHIRSSLTPENITTEICSAFTSRFAEVKKMENDYLKGQWKDIRSSRGFSKLISKAFADQPDGVSDLWLEFFKQL